MISYRAMTALVHCFHFGDVVIGEVGVCTALQGIDHYSGTFHFYNSSYFFGCVHP
jgi:hypothetical protein